MPFSGSLPHHDYDSAEFLSTLQTLAQQGLTDKEIADALNLRWETFSRMKNGIYQGWNEEENAARSERFRNVIDIGRRKIVALLRGKYIKAAVGSIKTHSITKRYVTEKCPCDGDPACPDCAGEGWVYSTTKAVAQETETEMPPNMQALATLLYHYDPEWRRVERRQDDEAEEIPSDVPHGIDIGKWIIKETETADD